jgi:hypothetical protein
VAVSQPGHDTKGESILNRYKTLKDAGVAGVAYLADNDKTGIAKGNKCQIAAAAVGLPFLLLHAVDVWPGICAGGSIDDAPGNAINFWSGGKFEVSEYYKGAHGNFKSRYTFYNADGTTYKIGFDDGTNSKKGCC